MESAGLLFIELVQQDTPTPTGRYDARREAWRCDPSALFPQEHLQAILDFLKSGGSLLAFAYRFGDAFTQTNLGDVFASLGLPCLADRTCLKPARSGC